MSCAELYKKGPAVKKVTRRDFHMLHHDGRTLIHSWFERGWKRTPEPGEPYFENFIFAWIGFNGWASCVTGSDNDAEVIKSLISDPELCRLFSEQIGRNGTLSQSVRDLLRLTPIFDVKALRQQRIEIRFAGNDDRRERIEYYFSEGATKFEPQCWLRHRGADEQIPLDWPHALSTIYKIRCNLFHGQKAAHSEMDRQIVFAAFRVLGQFIEDAQLI